MSTGKHRGDRVLYIIISGTVVGQRHGEETVFLSGDVIGNREFIFEGRVGGRNVGQKDALALEEPQSFVARTEVDFM